MQMHYTETGELQFLHGSQVVWVLVNLLQPVELHSQLPELLQRGDVGGCEGTPFRSLNVDLAKQTSVGCCCLPSVLQGLRQGLATGLPGLFDVTRPVVVLLYADGTCGRNIVNKAA